MDAAEAEKRGLVSKVVPADQLLDTVVAVAEKIASNSKLINQVSLKTSSFLVSKVIMSSTFFHWPPTTTFISNSKKWIQP